MAEKRENDAEIAANGNGFSQPWKNCGQMKYFVQEFVKH